MIKETKVTPLIEMFKMCPVTNGKFDNNVFVIGLKKGYAISPLCTNEYAKSFINGITMKYNSTFYQTWGDVVNKDRFELFVDQVYHYLTSGMNIEYVPNTNPTEPEWTSYKVITPCTFEELYDRCMNMLTSGIALKSETVKSVTDYIIEYCKEYNVQPDVDSIKNREAVVVLCDALNILPKDGNKLFAHIVYKATGLTMIVKNRETRKLIRLNRGKVDDLFFRLNHNQLISLASVYNRYKELFVAFKCQFSKPVINKIGRLSKKYHKPVIKGFWDTIISGEPSVSQLRRCRDEVKTATNYRLIQVMQSIRERLLLASQEGDNMYLIRNGKVFVKENEYQIIDSRYEFWEYVYNLCKTQLIKNLSKKACKVKFPTNYTLVCPTSEKNFIGNVPIGTSCPLGKDNVIGIYWENDWGTMDFDLSYEDIKGNRIGWNSDFYNRDVVFSGDIVNAPNGANEVIRFKGNNIPNGVVYVNRYNGNPNSKYRLFFGSMDDKEYMVKDFYGDYCMVDPNKITLEAEITQGEMSQQNIGIIINGKFVFFALSSGYGKIASAIRKTKNNFTDDVVQILQRKSKVYIPLKEILLEAGFKESDTDFEIDLTELSKDTLISLFDN